MWETAVLSALCYPQSTDNFYTYLFYHIPYSDSVTFLECQMNLFGHEEYHDQKDKQEKAIILFAIYIIIHWFLPT